MSKDRRRRGFSTIPNSISNPSVEQIKRYLSIARRMNDPATAVSVNDSDLEFLIGVSLGEFDNAKLTEAVTEINKNREAGKPAIDVKMYRQYADEARKQLSTPEYKDRVLRIAEQADIKAQNTKFSNGLDLLLSGADLTAAQSQIRSYKNKLRELRRPGTPPILGRDPYLAAAKKAAEEGGYQESIAAEAAKQDIREAAQGELQAAKVASAGQAGAYGAMAQAAATRRGRRSLEMMPGIENIAANRRASMANLASMSAQENANILQSMQNADLQNRNMYIAESEALAGLGSQAYSNRRAALAGIGEVLPEAIGNPRVRRKYQNLYDKLWAMGVPPEQADKFSQQVVAPENRISGYYGPSNTPSEIAKTPYDIAQKHKENLVRYLQSTKNSPNPLSMYYGPSNTPYDIANSTAYPPEYKPTESDYNSWLYKENYNK